MSDTPYALTKLAFSLGSTLLAPRVIEGGLYHSGDSDVSLLQKEAARRGLKVIRDLIRKGNLAKANILAKTEGVLKPSALGSEIKSLGRGAEGVADLVAHPEMGVAVRKTYDPLGLSSEKLIARKAQAGKALGQNPAVAAFKGEAAAPGGTSHFYEYIPSGKTPFAPGSAAETAAVRQTKADTLRGLRKGGFFGGADVREGNMIWDARAGRYRTIDYIPTQKGEFFTNPQHLASKHIGVGPEYAKEIAKDYGGKIPENVMLTRSGSEGLFNPATGLRGEFTPKPRWAESPSVRKAVKARELAEERASIARVKSQVFGGKDVPAAQLTGSASPTSSVATAVERRGIPPTRKPILPPTRVHEAATPGMFSATAPVSVGSSTGINPLGQTVAAPARPAYDAALSQARKQLQALRPGGV